MVSPPRTIPRRGDIIGINLQPQSGHEQSGRRPALVLSPESYNSKTGLAILCPITAQRKGYPFEVPLPTGLPVTGVILADQVKSLDWRTRQASFICALLPDVVTEVLQKLLLLLTPPGN